LCKLHKKNAEVKGVVFAEDVTKHATTVTDNKRYDHFFQTSLF